MSETAHTTTGPAAQDGDEGGKPSVLFVCIHNAGRSQMAAGFARHYGGEALTVRSAGSDPATSVNPVAVAAMAELGIDIAGQTPTKLDYDTTYATDVIITMGCDDACPVFTGKRYEDWKLDDPAGQDIDVIRPIRDDIHTRVRVLVAELLPDRALP